MYITMTTKGMTFLNYQDISVLWEIHDQQAEKYCNSKGKRIDFRCL